MDDLTPGEVCRYCTTDHGRGPCEAWGRITELEFEVRDWRHSAKDKRITELEESGLAACTINKGLRACTASLRTLVQSADAKAESLAMENKELFDKVKRLRERNDVFRVKLRGEAAAYEAGRRDAMAGSLRKLKGPPGAPNDAETGRRKPKATDA